MRVAGTPASLAPVCLIAAIVATQSVAAAGDDDRSSEQFVQRGIEARRAGRNRDALEAFQHAQALHPTPRTAAQIALARQALADWVGAESGLEEALRATEDAWIARYREVLEHSLETVRDHLASLYVEANVTRGELVLNGAPACAIPAPGQPLRVVAGSLSFEVRAPGYLTVQRTVEISPRAEVHVVITLEPVGTPPHPVTPSATQDLVQGPGQLVLRDVGAHALSDESAPLGEAGRKTWAYVAFGGAGALAGAGVAAWRVRENNVSIFNDDKRCLTGTQTRAEQCGGQLQTANIALGLEIAAFGAAAGAAGIGAWLLWWPRARSSHRAAACTPWATLGFQCTRWF